MTKKGRRRGKHIPQRTCVGCREVGAKGDLLRLVRTPEGVLLDEGGKMNGRGAYVHANQECIRQALTGRLEQALRMTLSDRDRDQVQVLMSGLPLKKRISETAEESNVA